MAKPFLEEAGRLTDKAEKLVELYKPQMKSVDEIVPLTDLFFADFPELTEAEKEVMAGETVPTVLESFKAKLEAMSDDEFVAENIFPQIKAVQKENRYQREEPLHANPVLPFQVRCMVLNCQIPSTCLVVKNLSNTLKKCWKKLQNRNQLLKTCCSFLKSHRFDGFFAEIEHRFSQND